MVSDVAVDFRKVTLKGGVIDDRVGDMVGDVVLGDVMAGDWWATCTGDFVWAPKAADFWWATDDLVWATDFSGRQSLVGDRQF